MKKLAILFIFFSNIVLGVVIATLYIYSDQQPIAFAQANILTEKDMSGLSLQKNFNKIAKIAIPAVVSIQVEALVGNEYQDYAQEFFRRFFGGNNVPNQQKRTVQGFGSGFVISEDGYIVSNYHVVKGAQKLIVSFDDDIKYDAEVVGHDERTDLALLKIKGNHSSFSFLSLGASEDLNIGDIVIAIGNPFNLSHTFTSGVVSAKGRNNVNPNSRMIQNFIQTDVAINPGNSGGPLLNLKGEVIGINSMILSPGNAGNIGIGFSIPINLAKPIINQLKLGGKVERGYLGIVIDTFTPELAEAMKIKHQGVYISQVAPSSPAEKAKLQRGDILIEIDGNPIKNYSDLVFQVYSIKVGETVEMLVVRDGKTIKVNVKIEKEPKGDIAQAKSKEKLGIRVTNASQNVLSINRVKQGVIVSDLNQSPLGFQGVVIGDVITQINNTKIKSIEDFEKALSEKTNSYLFYIVRNGVLRLIQVKS